MPNVGRILPGAYEMRRISAAQFRKLGGRRKISKENLERIEKGLDPILSEDQEAELLNPKLEDLLLPDHQLEDDTIPGILEYSHNGNESGQAGTPNIVAMMAAKKRRGVRRGNPDYWIAIRNDLGEKALVWIELKKERGPNGGLNGSEISDEQRRMIAVLGSIPNVAAHFAHGHAEALEILESYIFTLPNDAER